MGLIMPNWEIIKTKRQNWGVGLASVLSGLAIFHVKNASRMLFIASSSEQ
jgi:hypothetical protein